MSNIKDMPVPDTVGVELYNLGDGKFGVRIVLPEGRSPEDYKVAKDERIRVCEMEHQVGQIIASVACLDNCVEAVYFNGEKSDVSGSSVSRMVEESIKGVLHEIYKSEIDRGIVPKSVSFERWIDEEYDRVIKEERKRLH